MNFTCSAPCHAIGKQDSKHMYPPKITAERSASGASCGLSLQLSEKLEARTEPEGYEDYVRAVSTV